MPRTNVYGDRKLKSVICRVGTSTDIVFAFLTPLDDSDSTALGHATIPEDPPAGLVFGANSPRPMKATKRGVTSYLSHSALTTARQAGWRIVRPVQFRQTQVYSGTATPDTTRSGSVGVFVVTRGVSYAWRIPNYQLEHLPETERSILKINIPTAEADARKMVYGASFPRPGRAAKEQADSNGTILRRITTFHGDTALPFTADSGWETAKAAVAILPRRG